MQSSLKMFADGGVVEDGVEFASVKELEEGNDGDETSNGCVNKIGLELGPTLLGSGDKLSLQISRTPSYILPKNLFQKITVFCFFFFLCVFFMLALNHLLFY